MNVRDEEIRAGLTLGSRERHRSRRGAGRGGLVLAAAALVVASCQNDGALVGATRATTSAVPVAAASSPATAATPPTAAASRLRAEDYVLSEGPVTAGFTATPADPLSNADDGGISRVADCIGLPADQFSSEHEDQADGPDFTSDTDELVTIASSAQIVSAEKVSDDLEILNHPRFAECFGQVMQEEFDADTGSGAQVEIVASESPEPPAGASGLLRVSMGVTVGGETIGFVLDNLFFFEGRVEAFVNYTNVGNIPAPDHVQRIADQMSGKLQVQ